ncbi:MAG TPA: tetratricopeptide repeat protein, partial [Candidatus Krumholzibacteria bacterium]|nr:tetratricopeptide repeat protein [Candidatus Krumholzibacteria bacterium]
YYRASFDMHRATSGPEHPVLANIMNDIGLLMYDRGEYRKADQELDESLVFQRSSANGVDRNPMSVAMVRRAQVLVVLGRLAEADTLASRGVAISRRLHDDRGMWMAGGLMTLADVRLHEGAVAEAESLFSDSLARMRSLEQGGVARPRDSGALLGLCRCRLAQGDVAGAEKYAREALGIEKKFRRPGHPDTARAEIALAEVLIKKGQAPGARELLQDAVAALSPLVQPGQIDLTTARQLLAGHAAGMR